MVRTILYPDHDDAIYKMVNEISPHAYQYLESQEWYSELSKKRKVSYGVCSSSLRGYCISIEFRVPSMIAKCAKELDDAGFPLTIFDITYTNYVRDRYGIAINVVILGSIGYFFVNLWNYEFTCAFILRTLIILHTLMTCYGYAFTAMWSGGMFYETFYPYLMSWYLLSLFWVPELVQWSRPIVLLIASTIYYKFVHDPAGDPLIQPTYILVMLYYSVK